MAFIAGNVEKEMVKHQKGRKFIGNLGCSESKRMGSRSMETAGESGEALFIYCNLGRN